MTSKQVEKLDGDWELIQVVCNESEKARKLVVKSIRGHRFYRIEVRRSLIIMKKHHKQVKLSFRQKSTVLRKLSPRAAKYVQRELKYFDDELEIMTNSLNKWPWNFFDRLNLESFATRYRNFGLEVKMYRDLVKNARKSVVE